MIDPEEKVAAEVLAAKNSRRRWALLVVVITLALGVGSGLAFGRVAQRPMHVALSCMLLNEAEKPKYLDRQRQATLVEKLMASTSLSRSERESAARFVARERRLQSACSKRLLCPAGVTRITSVKLRVTGRGPTIDKKCALAAGHWESPF